MPRESPVLKFFMMVFGNTLYSHITFMDRLRERLNLQKVTSEGDSDVIIAFVAVASRAGTDIEAALRRIPSGHQAVVLVVLHHTFDPHFVAPDSRMNVNRRNVFTVDCLYHEDRGLLSCLHNDEALAAVTRYLNAKGAPVHSPVHFEVPQALSDTTEYPLHVFVIVGVAVAMLLVWITGQYNLTMLLLGAGMGAGTGYLAYLLYHRSLNSAKICR
ncbi:uncharacterized protein [Salminus brasiliensis]|uniref:uncharacterized protein n=1 Tax=Salminus brasiliensis TaxID=930266 RepID=UPI003B8360AD